MKLFVAIPQPPLPAEAYAAFKAAPSERNAAQFLEAVRYELEDELWRLGIHQEYVDVIQSISMGLKADSQITSSPPWWALSD